MVKSLEDMGLEEMKTLLGALSGEQSDLELAIDEMIAAMADLPPDRRATGGWGPSGEMTLKYLALTNRQAEVEADIVALNRAMSAGAAD